MLDLEVLVGLVGLVLMANHVIYNLVVTIDAGDIPITMANLVDMVNIVCLVGQGVICGFLHLPY